MAKSKNYVTEGPIFSRLFGFTLPIILGGLLQVMYNIADNIVVGRFSGDELALAAVGSTGTLTTLVVNFLLGFATGSGVIIARDFGSGDMRRASRSLHTAMGLAITSGLLFCAVAFACSAPALTAMQTKPEVFSRALLYFRIICLGIPATTIYNFNSSALRSMGNSKTPLYILSVSGLINVLLNLFFVIVCGMTVDGVATATVISQYISAIAVTVVLCRAKNEDVRLRLKKIRIDKGVLVNIMKIGMPAAVQASLFSVSNIILSSAANTLPTTAVSGRTIAFNIDGLVYTAMEGYRHATVTYVGQNYGAKNPERLKKSILYTICQVTIIGILVGQVLVFFNKDIISLYIDPMDPNIEAVTNAASELSVFILSIYFLCGINNVLAGALRGLGKSVSAMVVGIISSCIIRMIWIFGFFFTIPSLNNLVGLYYCYPITWLFSITVQTVMLLVAWPSVKRKLNEAKEVEDAA